MAKVTYIEANGERHEIELQPGISLMRGAVDNSVPGILGECGGQLACGTCLVYIDAGWRQTTGEASDMEEAMLELHAGDPTPGKRLSCQIKVTDELDGLVVHMPVSQG